MLFGPRAPKAPPSIALSAMVAVLALTSCGGSEYRYVKNSSIGTFFKVPNDWKIFDEDQVLQTSEGSEEAKASFKELSWSVGFDASPKPSVKNVLGLSTHPNGLVRVRTLTPGERDTFSQSSLRALLLEFDPLSEEAADAGGVEVVGSREVDQGDFHGTEFLLNLKTIEGGVLKWRQIGLVDSKLKRAHVLAITCTADCYEKNEGVIEKVISSWTVKER